MYGWVLWIFLNTWLFTYLCIRTFPCIWIFKHLLRIWIFASRLKIWLWRVLSEYDFICKRRRQNGVWPGKRFWTNFSTNLLCIYIHLVQRSRRTKYVIPPLYHQTTPLWPGCDWRHSNSAPALHSPTRAGMRSTAIAFVQEHAHRIPARQIHRIVSTRNDGKYNPFVYTENLLRLRNQGPIRDRLTRARADALPVPTRVPGPFRRSGTVYCRVTTWWRERG